MSLGDELGKLGELHQRGVLSDDEFARAKARLLSPAAADHAPGAAVAAANAFRRSRDDRWLGGVCGGLAALSGMATWVWRLFFTLLMLCAGTGVALYLLLWIFVPDAPAQPSAPRGAAA